MDKNTARKKIGDDMINTGNSFSIKTIFAEYFKAFPKFFRKNGLILIGIVLLMLFLPPWLVGHYYARVPALTADLLTRFFFCYTLINYFMLIVFFKIIAGFLEGDRVGSEDFLFIARHFFVLLRIFLLLILCAFPFLTLLLVITRYGDLPFLNFLTHPLCLAGITFLMSVYLIALTSIIFSVYIGCPSLQYKALPCVQAALRILHTRIFSWIFLTASVLMLVCGYLIITGIIIVTTLGFFNITVIDLSGRLILWGGFLLSITVIQSTVVLCMLIACRSVLHRKMVYFGIAEVR